MQNSTRPQLAWHDPTWQKQAQDWIRMEAGRNSMHITGGIEQPHAYAWIVPEVLPELMAYEKMLHD